MSLPVSREWLERKRSIAVRAPDAPGAPLSLLFREQLAVVYDPAKFKALLCGRRAGKTDVIIKDFAHGMMSEPGSRNLYIALTLESAREILWEPFKALNEKHSWGFHFDHSLHIVTHPNGSRLLVKGADDHRSLERLRGQRFRRVRIDECGAHRQAYLAYLVLEVLEAALMDDPNSDFWLAGTCTLQAFGFFYDITTGALPGYSTHRWTARANPFVDFVGFVYGLPGKPGLLVRRGWTEDNPIFRREYLAEWVLDSERLVMRFARERNCIETLPPLREGDQWVRILSLDFGVGHHTAAVVLAHPLRWGRDAYIIHSWQATGLAPSDAAERIRKTYDDWKPRALIGDVNGLGKGYEREWNKLFGDIPMRPAQKADKRAALEIVSDRLHVAKQSDVWSERLGLFVLPGNDELCAQFATVQWDEERVDVASGQDDDLLHAAVYAYRYCPAFANKDAEPPPLPASTSPFDRFINRKQLPCPPKSASDSFRGAFRRGR